MNEKDLSKIESRLKITLPDQYRGLMLKRGTELSEFPELHRDLPPFYLNPDAIISVNKLERPKHGVSDAFPKWWETFFLVGTTGAGNYYCVRLDDKPGVWLIGTDCGDTPTLVARNLKVYVDRVVKELKKEQAQAAKRKAAREKKALENSAAVHPKAKAWLKARSIGDMFEWLDKFGFKIDARRLRLFGIACCERLEKIQGDRDCVKAIQLAKHMGDGTADRETLKNLRDRLKTRYFAEEDTWGIAAANGLLQDADSYLNGSKIETGDPDLLQVGRNTQFAAGFSPELSHAQARLLREILGTPFDPIPFESIWRTTNVIELARSIYQGEKFDQMAILADALEDAGCDDQRIIDHCREKGEHVRGCWVIDAILAGQQETREPELPWGFEWPRPNVNAAALKKRMQGFGADALKGRPPADRDALAFADWLEANGDPAWARYIRVRCALDGKAPGADYPDLVEECLESGAAMVSTVRSYKGEFDGFYFSGYRFAENDWREDSTDDMEKGLPSLVNAVGPGDSPPPVEVFIERLKSLVRNSPVRGIDLEEHYPNQAEEIFHSDGAARLRSLKFDNKPAPGQTGPVLEALAKSPVVKSLERLCISNGISSDQDAKALAGAPFEKLRRLDLSAFCGFDCSDKAAIRLLSARWFRQLHELRTGFGYHCCETAMHHLAGMPHLHTFVMWIPSERQILAMGRTEKFPALRRLYIHCGDLSGKCREAFCKFRAPKLMEIWLRNCKLASSDIRAIASSPLFGKLRALTFDGTSLENAGLEAIAGSACAAELRILRLKCCESNLRGGFRSLVDTPLTKHGAFPKLTTLQIDFPFTEDAKRDTAEFLTKLSLPNLRHLSLVDCEFDDDCARALAANPRLAGLTRLNFDRYHYENPLTPSAAKKLFRSPTLKNLVELEFSNLTIGDALEVFCNKTVMPMLACGSFSFTNASPETIERITRKRPEIYVGT